MRHTREKLAWTLAAALALFVVASLAGVARGGPLDPSGSPAPTMNTLENIPGSWSRSLSSTGGCNSARFTCVLDSVAVMDRETGLVWSRNANPLLGAASWSSAVQFCQATSIGGRLGWRLPTIEELASLLEDPSGNGPNLPVGHPFNFVQAGSYWSSTTADTTPFNAKVVDLTGVFVTSVAKSGANGFTWCVRGNQGYDAP